MRSDFSLNKSAIDLSNASHACDHKEARRSTGHIMGQTHYSDQEGSKSRQNPCQVQPTEKLETYWRQDNVFGYELQFLMSGVLPSLPTLNYKLQRRLLDDVLPFQQSQQYKKYSSFRKVTTRRQVIRHFASNSSDH